MSSRSRHSLHQTCKKQFQWISIRQARITAREKVFVLGAKT